MTNQEKLEKMLLQAVDGIMLTDQELRILKWLSGLDGYTVEPICSIIQKCREEGQAHEEAQTVC